MEENVGVRQFLDESAESDCVSPYRGFDGWTCLDIAQSVMNASIIAPIPLFTLYHPLPRPR
jgi:hypothetical protein